jgi:hypothetical protein
MGRNDRATQSQTHPEAIGLGGDERFEDFFQHGGRQTRSTIDHDDCYFI